MPSISKKGFIFNSHDEFNAKFNSDKFKLKRTDVVSDSVPRAFEWIKKDDIEEIIDEQKVLREEENIRESGFAETKPKIKRLINLYEGRPEIDKKNKRKENLQKDGSDCSNKPNRVGRFRPLYPSV